MLNNLSIFWLLLAFSNLCNCEYIKIGGLFDNTTSQYLDFAFESAIETANTETLEPNNIQKLIPITVRLQDQLEFTASRKLCQLLTRGVGAVIGPQSTSSALHVQSICDSKEMPHIETRWDPTVKTPSLNMYPHPQAISKIFLDLIKLYNWASFTILFESSLYLPLSSDLLKLYDSKGHTITVRQIDLGIRNNYRPVLRRVKLSEENNIIIDCSIDILEDVLKQAQQVGLMTDQHNIIITSLDLHTIDLEPFKYSGTNITGVRLIDPDHERVQQVTNFWQEQYKQRNRPFPDELQAEKLSTSLALTFDGVLLYAEAFKKLKGTRQLKPIILNCEDNKSWGNGNSIINYMKTTPTIGLTREIKFDHMGLRTDFLLDIVELGSDKLNKIGVWNSSEPEKDRLNITRQHINITDVNSQAASGGSLRNKTFTVIIALTDPYGMLKESFDHLSGNDRYEGYAIDLITELSLILGFNYTFIVQENGVYGTCKAGVCNGMLQELIENNADLAITDLTITSERVEAVEFTTPFMNLGVSILYRKPTKDAPSTFSFMSPFSQGVWLCLGFAYISVSLLLFILGRLSPKEWDNPYACIEEPEVYKNQLTISNCFWLTIGVLLQQGSDIAPKTPSTRSVASIWSFFTLIMVSSYTANLAAFLTVQSIHPIINSAEDLVNHVNGVNYGAKRDGSTIEFLNTSSSETHKKMYQFLKANPQFLTSDNNEGKERVLKENYAFLMESVSIEYIAERECNLTNVGGKLDEKGYGIAMRKNSYYKDAFTEAILSLQERDVLSALKTKWWKEKRGGGACSLAPSSDEDKHLDMKNVGGVFLVLSVGCCIAFVFGIIECIFLIVQRAKELEVPIRHELTKELVFISRYNNNVKVIKPHGESETGSQKSIVSSE